MKIEFNWDKPIELKKDLSGKLHYIMDYDALPDGPGVYVFARKHGSALEAIYVGQALNIRSRMKSHTKHGIVLMKHIMDQAKNGRRLVFFSQCKIRKNANLKDALKIAEKALIRKFVASGNDLINIKGKKISYHEVIFNGKQPKKFIPSSLLVEKN